MAERDPHKVDEGTDSREGRPRVKGEVVRDAVREVLLEIPGFRALAEQGIAEGVMSELPSSAGTDRATVGGSETLATAVPLERVEQLRLGEVAVRQRRNAPR